jgi:predicted RNA-binding Zn-ribbon protein involved in translation (DUF1610 family)
MPAEGTTLADALVTLLGEHAGTWSGTAAELHALLPGHAVDAVRLAKALTQAAGDLTAAGITIERKRQAGTGARILALTLGADLQGAWSPMTVDAPAPAAAPEDERQAVTVSAPASAVTIAPAGTTETIEHPDRPRLPCPTCGSSNWTWRQTARRRASRWYCPTCEPQP